MLGTILTKVSLRASKFGAIVNFPFLNFDAIWFKTLESKLPKATA